MSFANINILPWALSLIPKTKFQYRKFISNDVNEFGQAVATYGEWTDAFGIVVPSGMRDEHVEGIDFAKSRMTVFIQGVDLSPTHNVKTPDQILYCCKIYNIVSADNWLEYDNFRRCECVEVTNFDGNVNPA